MDDGGEISRGWTPFNCAARPGPIDLDTSLTAIVSVVVDHFVHRASASIMISMYNTKLT